MTALTNALNDIIPSFGPTAYDYEPNISIVKFDNRNLNLSQKITKSIIKMLGIKYKDSYLLIERGNSLLVCIWKTDEEHYNALKIKYTVHLEQLLKVQKQRIKIMQESLPILEEMVALKPKLDSSIIELTKII